MANELARLFVVIGASTKDFNKEIGAMEKNIKSTMGNIKKELEKAGVALTGFGLAVTAVLGKAVEGFAKFGDELAQMSAKIGIGAENLSALKYVGDVTGVSLDTLGTSIKGMANFLETARDGSSSAAQALNKLHISVNDLKGLSPEQMFMKLSSAIADVPDPLQRSALAVDIFGRSGTDLLPMLALGKDGIQTLMERAHELGVTMTYEDVVAAQNLSRAFTDLQSSVQGVMNEIGAALAPVLTWLIDNVIVPLITAIHNWAEAHPDLFNWIVITTGAVGLLALALGGVMLAIVGLIMIAPAMAVAWGLITGPIGLIVIGIMLLIGAIAALVIYWEEVWNGIKWFTRAVVNFLINSVLGMVNAYVNMFIGLINTVISLLNLLPRVEISKIATLNLHYEVPEFQTGGLFTRPTLGIIGEAGPEVVMPLSKLGGIAGGAAGTVINNFSFPNYLGSRDEVMSWMRESLLITSKSNVNLGLA
jgi:hypothetical protein